MPDDHLAFPKLSHSVLKLTNNIYSIIMVMQILFSAKQ